MVQVEIFSVKSMIKHFKKQWPIIGIMVILLVVASYLVKFGRKVIQEPDFNVVIDGEGIKLKDIHFTQNDLTKGLEWVLDAKEVKSSLDKNTVLFQDFHLKLKPQNRPFIKFKGNEGVYTRKSGEINLWGELEGYSEDGYRFITERVLFNEKTGFLTTNKPVKISGPFFTVTGKGLYVDLKKERLKISSDVTAILNNESL